MDNNLLNEGLIAPCGMNCGVCYAYLREKNNCLGCLGPDNHKPNHCKICRIKNCGHLAESGSKFCFGCKKSPCARLKQLDKRYKAKYGMSMIENLNTISNDGIIMFLAKENERWECISCGAIICVHRENCTVCGKKWNKTGYTTGC